jgi:hypothetical protein
MRIPEQSVQTWPSRKYVPATQSWRKLCTVWTTGTPASCASRTIQGESKGKTLWTWTTSGRWAASMRRIRVTPAMLTTGPVATPSLPRMPSVGDRRRSPR